MTRGNLFNGKSHESFVRIKTVTEVTLKHPSFSSIFPMETAGVLVISLAVEVSCSTTWPEGNWIPRCWQRERSSGWSVSDGISNWPSCTFDDTFQYISRIFPVDFGHIFGHFWTSCSTWMIIWRMIYGKYFSMDGHGWLVCNCLSSGAIPFGSGSEFRIMISY